MKSFKSSLSVIISFCLLFVFITGNVGASDIETDTNNYKIIENNDSKTIVYSEKDGIEAYVTYDKLNEEFTAKTIEKPQNILKFSFSPSVEKEYSIDVNTATNEEVKAVFTDTTTDEQFLLNTTSNDISVIHAQAPVILIPVVEWLGSLVVAALAASAKVMLDDILYVSASEASVSTDLKNKKDRYFLAYVDYSTNLVFVGPDVNYGGAKGHLQSSDKNNIFTYERKRAKTLATNVTNQTPHEHTREWETKGEGYFKHFHPGSLIHAKGYKPNHIWYLN